jgi:hypothetical protein
MNLEKYDIDKQDIKLGFLIALVTVIYVIVEIVFI